MAVSYKSRLREGWDFFRFPVSPKTVDSPDCKSLPFYISQVQTELGLWITRLEGPSQLTSKLTVKDEWLERNLGDRLELERRPGVEKIGLGDLYLIVSEVGGSIDVALDIGRLEWWLNQGLYHNVRFYEIPTGESVISAFEASGRIGERRG